MFLYLCQVHNNSADFHDHTPQNNPRQFLDHCLMEHHWCICDTKRHPEVFKENIMTPEGSLWNVSFRNLHHVIPHVNVQCLLDENPHTSSHFVQNSVVNEGGVKHWSHWLLKDKYKKP